MCGAGDLDDGGDEFFPFGSGDGLAGVEHGDGAGFAAVMPAIAGRGSVNGLCGGRYGLHVFTQDRLIVLQLNDKMSARLNGGFESFFDNAWRPA